MIYKVLSLTLAMFVLLTGCTSSPTTSPPGAGTKDLETPAAKPNQAQPQASPVQEQSKPANKAQAGSAPSGALVSVISSFGEDVLDPILGSPYNTQALIEPMFERLIGDDGKGKLVPQLADSWSVSPDGKTWTFKLHKGVKFHNGDDLTSADVKFSLERIMSPKSRNTSAGPFRTAIDRIETPDAYTVSVVTKNVDATFAYLFCTLKSGLDAVVPKKYIEEKGEDYFAQHPVGSGPWKFVKHDSGSSLELEAVKDHWRVVPAFEKLTIKLVPEESTRVAMLKRGEADVIDISLDRIQELKAAGFTTTSASTYNQPDLYIPGTWLDTGQPTMDLKVRQALSLAMNREEISKEFFGGSASPAARDKIDSNTFGWDSSWKPDTYDPQKAKQLLAEAGYPSKFKDPVITLFSYPQPGAAWQPKLMEIISAYWEAVGIKTKIVPIDFATIRTMYLAKPPDPKIVGGVFPNFVPVLPEPLNAMYPDFGMTGPVALLRDQEWEDTYQKALKELDDGKRTELVRWLVNRAYDHYANIPTVAIIQAYGISNKVSGWPAVINVGYVYDKLQHK